MNYTKEHTMELIEYCIWYLEKHTNNEMDCLKIEAELKCLQHHLKSFESK